MKLMTVALVAAFVSGPEVGCRAEKQISQKGRAYSESAVTVKKGDTLTFVNDDNIAHNIMSSTAGNEFNLGSQAPGALSNVTLGNAGEVAVLCAIHPRMKMSVQVTD